MIRVHVESTEGVSYHPYLGNVPTYTWSLIDDNGRSYSSDEVRDLFSKLEIIGVQVMQRFDAPDEVKLGDYTWGGHITDITEEAVYVSGSPIPRDKFLDWYELD